MTENELLAELILAIAPAIEPDEVTVRMLMDATGCSDNKAMQVLKGREAAGELSSRQVRLPTGHTATAWRKVAVG